MKFEGTDLYGGLTTEHRGFTCVATTEYDQDMGEPWKEHDGHGIVSEWTTRQKLPGERILIEDSHPYSHSRRYYNVQETMRIALRDGWDAEPYGEGTKRQRAARAVEADFQHLRQWCNDDWHWCYVKVAAMKEGLELGTAYLGGINSDANEYLVEVANELLDDACDEAEATLERLCKR